MNDQAAPLVSVVIPTYNHAHFLGRALQSVLDQTYKKWEVIVIDNYSTDKTEEVIRNFVDPRITYLKFHNNGVIAASRNKGIRAAKGEWIAFLDSDDWWTIDKLQACFDCINDQVDFIYHKLENVSDQPRLLRRKIARSWQVKSPVFTDLLLKGNAIANSSVVVRKSLLAQIGGINESAKMIASEDYNAWLRIAQLTDRFRFVSMQLGFYQLHKDAISLQKDMSEPVLHAVGEFLNLLSLEQKIKVEAELKYIKGRFEYLAGNTIYAKKNLLFSFLYGRIFIKIKSIVMLINLYCSIYKKSDI